MKRKRIVQLAFIVLFLALAGLSGLTIEFHRDYLNIPPNHLIGNRPSSLAALKDNGFPFSFLVIGDTQTNETAETLIETALQEGSASFMVILGDFVKEPDIWRHRFFLTEMTSEIKPSFPVFLVSGNHDIDYFPSGKKSTERRVTVDIYEFLYGARNFDFVFNNCLFIICGVDLRNPASYLDELRHTLSQKGRGKKHIFVFVHYPPKGLAEYIPAHLPHEEEFFSLLEAHGDVTCFFGDFHGYWRGQRKGVNLIVTGGGGHLKQSQPEWGKFNHILRVTVDENKMSEEVITLSKMTNLEDAFEEMIFTKIFAVIQNKSWVLYVLFLLFSVAAIYSLILFAASFHPRPTLKKAMM